MFWIIYGPDGSIATFDPKTNKLTRYGTDCTRPRSNLKNPAYALLEDHEGTMWFGTAVRGLLKFDREHRCFISYHNPGDSDSLADNRVIALFEDREKNIWVGMHDVEPHFFATRPPPFTKFTNPSGSRDSISPGLVGALYEDRQGVLWVGVNRSLVRIDRKTGLSSSFQPTVAGLECFRSSKTDQTFFGLQARIRCCVITGKPENFDDTVHDSQIHLTCAAVAYSG